MFDDYTPGVFVGVPIEITSGNHFRKLPGLPGTLHEHRPLECETSYP